MTLSMLCCKSWYRTELSFYYILLNTQWYWLSSCWWDGNGWWIDVDSAENEEIQKTLPWHTPEHVSYLMMSQVVLHLVDSWGTARSRWLRSEKVNQDVKQRYPWLRFTRQLALVLGLIQCCTMFYWGRKIFYHKRLPVETSPRDLI